MYVVKIKLAWTRALANGFRRRLTFKRPIVVEIVEIVCLKRQKTNDKGGRGWFIKIALS